MRRVLVISHTYVQPAHRGKLRALAARGLEVTVAIPQHWREPWFGKPMDVTWERQGGLEVFPLPARGMGTKGELEKAKYGRRALKALLRDRRPDLVQIEEEPTTIVPVPGIRIPGPRGLCFGLARGDIRCGWAKGGGRRCGVGGGGARPAAYVEALERLSDDQSELRA